MRKIQYNELKKNKIILNLILCFNNVHYMYIYKFSHDKNFLKIILILLKK